MKKNNTEINSNSNGKKIINPKFPTFSNQDHAKRLDDESNNCSAKTT